MNYDRTHMSARGTGRHGARARCDDRSAAARSPARQASLPRLLHRRPSPRNLQRQWHRAAADWKDSATDRRTQPSASHPRPPLFARRGGMSRRTPPPSHGPATDGLLTWTSRRMRGRARHDLAGASVPSGSLKPMVGHLGTAGAPTRTACGSRPQVRGRAVSGAAGVGRPGATRLQPRRWRQASGSGCAV